MKSLISAIFLLTSTLSFAVSLDQSVLFKGTDGAIYTGTVEKIDGKDLYIDVDGLISEPMKVAKNKVGTLLENKCLRGTICEGMIVTFYNGDQLTEGEVLELYSNEFLIVEFGDNEETILDFAAIEGLK